MTQISNGESGSSVRTKLNASLAKTDQYYTNAGNVASGSTTDIGAVTGDGVTITGTTTINSLGTVAAGVKKLVKFAGALQLTHNGTSLILPTGANITTAAGDAAWVESLGSGNWVCHIYFRNSGKAIVAPAFSEVTSKPTTVAGYGITDVHGTRTDKASATTVDLSTETSDYINITGTTTITGLGTVAAGKEFTLRFDAALTLTYNATSLITPTGANIVTEAGDHAVVRSKGSGNWEVVDYSRKSGMPLTNYGKVTNITGTYAVLDTDELINATSGTFTATLPTAVGRAGKSFTFKNSGSGIVTIATTSSQTIDGATSVVLGTQYNTLTVQSDGANWLVKFQRSVNIQTFTGSGTWTKPAGARVCQVIALGAGGGGGSGRRGAAATSRSGGAGGGAGALINYNILASYLGSTETVTVGAGGTGGAGVTADDTNGNAGTDGGDTTIGTLLRARGGKGGPGGTSSTPISAGTSVGVTSWYEEAGLVGGAGGNSGSSSSGTTTVIKPTGGGGGAGKTSGDANANGAAAGGITQNNGAGTADSGVTAFANVSGGALGSGGSGGAGNVTAAIPYYYGMTVGTGGGGAGSNNSGAGPAGGNAGGPGAGGGGGAGLENGRNGGKGGDGGNGWCVIVTYL